MKKSLAIAALFLVILAGNALAGGNGAMKVDFDPFVGWVNLNTAASGKVIATVHLGEALPNATFSVGVRVRYEDGSKDIYQDLTTFTTNNQGKGNFQVQLDIDPPEGSTTLRRIAIRLQSDPEPLYVAVAWDIPLK
jgi:hypothetical protein